MVIVGDGGGDVGHIGTPRKRARQRLTSDKNGSLLKEKRKGNPGQQQSIRIENKKWRGRTWTPGGELGRPNQTDITHSQPKKNANERQLGM